MRCISNISFAVEIRAAERVFPIEDQTEEIVCCLMLELIVTHRELCKVVQIAGASIFSTADVPSLSIFFVKDPQKTGESFHSRTLSYTKQC